MEYASLVEYAYITQTGVQSNPDPATISLPDTFKEAMESQHADEWKQAMDQHMGRSEEKGVYDVISRAAVPFNHKVIGTRWVYKVKSDFTFKARLVVQGWSQRPGIDCGATFAPVCRIENQRLLLAISTQRDWDIGMLDVKSAFLQSKIDEEVFTSKLQSTGYWKLQLEYPWS